MILVYVFEGNRLGPNRFQYKLRLEVQGKHPRVIHQISREFDTSININMYSFALPGAGVPLLEAEEVEAKSNLVYPYKITSWSNSYRIELPGRDIWASHTRLMSSTREMMMLSYATSDVNDSYRPDRSIREDCIFSFSYSFINKYKSIMSILTNIKDALLASRDKGRDVIITDIVSEISLRLNLMRLQYSG